MSTYYVLNGSNVAVIVYHDRGVQSTNVTIFGDLRFDGQEFVEVKNGQYHFKRDNLHFFANMTDVSVQH